MPDEPINLTERRERQAQRTVWPISVTVSQGTRSDSEGERLGEGLGITIAGPNGHIALLIIDPRDDGYYFIQVETPEDGQPLTVTEVGEPSPESPMCVCLISTPASDGPE